MVQRNATRSFQGETKVPAQQPMPSFFERAYRRLTRPLPPRIAARIDLLRPGYRRRWGGPMNGQERRRRIVTDLFREIAFDEIVETGTFRGSTTKWLSDVSDLPVMSVETEERFYLFAEAMCRDIPSVEILHGDSRELLRRLIARDGKRTTFFYLDAHWNEDVPRHAELRMIHDHWTQAVIMIDDFQVPGDEGYGYALYGGKPLDETYLPDLGDWQMFYPSVPSAQETGARRGYAIFASPDLANTVAGIAGLRPAGNVSGEAARA